MPKNEIELPEKDVKALVNQASERFSDDINELLKRKHAMSCDLLQWKYDVGGIAGCIVSDRAKALHERIYGAHVIRDVATQLEFTKEKALYACIRFANMFTAKDLKELHDKKWPWRGIVALLGVSDGKARSKFRADWEAGKYKNTDALKKAIADYNQKALANDDTTKGPVKEDGRGKKSTVVMPVKSADAIMTKVTGDTLPGLLEALDAAKSATLEEEQQVKMQTRLDHIKELIPAIKQMLDDTEKAIVEAGF